MLKHSETYNLMYVPYHVYMPWSQTPVVSCPLAISKTSLLPARHRSRSGEAGGLSDTMHRVSFHL